MKCQHGDYEGAKCAHCVADAGQQRRDIRDGVPGAESDADQKRREKSERIAICTGAAFAACACIDFPSCPHAIAAIERVLAERTAAVEKLVAAAEEARRKLKYIAMTTIEPTIEHREHAGEVEKRLREALRKVGEMRLIKLIWGKRLAIAQWLTGLEITQHNHWCNNRTCPKQHHSVAWHCTGAWCAGEERRDCPDCTGLADPNFQFSPEHESWLRQREYDQKQRAK